MISKEIRSSTYKLVIKAGKELPHAWNVENLKQF